MTVRVLIAFGTRPEAIKMAPIVRELKDRAREGGIEISLCVTGQHRQMLDQALDVFQMEPDYDLDVMGEDQSPSEVASLVLSRFEVVLRREHPDWVVVQGDTTTAAAASLSAFYSRAHVGHVEAGLRTHVKRLPFPEELNRRVVALVADLHFAPTLGSYNNLVAEGIDAKQVIVTGNPVVDALQWAKHVIDEEQVPGGSQVKDLLEELSGKRIVLLTAHRRESFGAPFEGVFGAVLEIAREFQDDIHFVFPVHPNPRVHEPAVARLSGSPSISLVPPLDYFDFVRVMSRAHVIVTDSGGLQEEGPALGVPVLMLRKVTERPEGVEAGAVRVVGLDPDRLTHELRALLNADRAREPFRAANIYGDGRAAQRIVASLLGEQVQEFQPDQVHTRD